MMSQASLLAAGVVVFTMFASCLDTARGKKHAAPRGVRCRLQRAAHWSAHAQKATLWASEGVVRYRCTGSNRRAARQRRDQPHKGGGDKQAE